MFFTKTHDTNDTVNCLRAEGMSTADIFRAFQMVKGSLAWEERWVSGGESTSHSERMEHLYWEMVRTY